MVMSLLEHPRAQELLAEARLTGAAVRHCQAHLSQFLQRYLPLFYRQEQRGVARQWCGRWGKVDNCQVGVFLAYAAPGGYALLDRRLYLPADWASDAKRRRKTHVPSAIVFQENWRIGLDLLQRSGPDVPHGW